MVDQLAYGSSKESKDGVRAVYDEAGSSIAVNGGWWKPTERQILLWDSVSDKF